MESTLPVADSLEEEVALLRVALRRLQREHDATVRNRTISEEIAETSKIRLLRAQAELEKEIVERKRVEREFYRVIQEAEEAINHKNDFVDALSKGLELPIKAARLALKMAATELSDDKRSSADIALMQLDLMSGTLERIRTSASHHSRKDEELAKAIHVLMQTAETALRGSTSSADVAMRSVVAGDLRRGAAVLLNEPLSQEKD